MCENEDLERRRRPRKHDVELLSSRSQRRRILEELAGLRAPPSVSDNSVHENTNEVSASSSPFVCPNDLKETCGSIIGVKDADASICSSVSGTADRALEKADELVHKDFMDTGPSTREQSFLADSTLCNKELLELDTLQEGENNWGTLHFECDTCLYCRCVSCGICLHSDYGECNHCESCMFECNSETSDDENFDKIFEELEGGSESLEDDVILSEDYARNLTMRKDLAEIFLKRRASHVLIDDILGFLNKHHLGKFPKSAKTLLKTPSVVTNLRDVPPGQYWHCGITEHIVKFATKCDVTVVDVTVSCDGVPIFNSAAKTFWPLTCSFNSSPVVFIIGVYLGNEKTKDANVYLKDFVDEVTPLCKHGLTLNGKVVEVNVVCAICDAPAKCFILSTKSFNAYFGCSKCTIEGEIIGRRMTFPELDASLRSDKSFVNHAQEEYHKDRSILETIPRFGCVTCVPLDYMHLLLLGLMRKLIYMWLEGPLTVGLPSVKVNAISDYLLNLVGWVPCDFARKTRPLQYVKRFKATEFRLIILYVGVVVFHRVLPQAIYEHFLVFHVITTIYVDPIFCEKYLDFAKELAQYFVATFATLYGQEYVNQDVHSFRHLGNDVQMFGALDNFSAFKFENFYQVLIKLMCKGEKPLQQLGNRYSEMEACCFFPGPISDL